MVSKISEGMAWPPIDVERYKMQEHSAWYSGQPEFLANFYYKRTTASMFELDHMSHNEGRFWARQISNDSSFFVHVPVANDIAETSASFIFGESPLVRFKSSSDEMKVSQESLDKMLTDSGFFARILEGAEIGSAIGGVFMKVSWDTDLCDEPIPVIVQCEQATPHFKFGKLFEVSFVYVVSEDDKSVYRLEEHIRKGSIENKLYQGSKDCIGKLVELDSINETEGMEEVIDTEGIMTAIYIPNMLPNRLNRQSPFGRSDYQGIETLMDELDETFTCWMTDIQVARARIHAPSGYIKGLADGRGKFDIDKMIYEEMDVDPTSMSKDLTATQFAIRADEFEKTSLNLLDRIITSAGYSPQSFGLNISGRAESGVALNVRERKSFATTNKKQAYWEQPLKQIVKAMCVIRGKYLNKPFNCDIDNLNIEFSDGITNNAEGLANTIKLYTDAKALSMDTKIRMIHPEWTDQQVEQEILKINNDGSPEVALDNPEDLFQIANKQALNNEASSDDKLTREATMYEITSILGKYKRSQISKTNAISMMIRIGLTQEEAEGMIANEDASNAILKV